MKLKSVFIISLLLIFVSATAAQSNQTAQNQYNPGLIGSGSPLYGLELAVDNAAVSIGVKKASKVAQERVAEVKAASKKNNTRGMERAAQAFENAAKKADSDESEQISEAESALEEAIQNAPEEAQQGLSTALENVRKDRANKSQEAEENRPDSPQNTQPDQDVRENLENNSPDTTQSQNISPEETRNRNQQTTDTSTTERSSATGRFDLMISDRPADISKFDFVNVSFSEARIFMKSQEEEMNDTSENETTEQTTDNQTTVNETINETENQTTTEETSKTTTEIDEESGNEGFRVVQLNNSSVDLTTVVGSKAESIADIELEEGTYTKIELYSSNIDAEINGSSVDVKIPPKKLMITKPFEVSANETTQFVFDIQVVMRGNERNNQGYILKPVISESGVAGKDVEVEEKTNRTEKEERRTSGREGGNKTETETSQGGQPETPGNGNPGNQNQRP